MINRRLEALAETYAERDLVLGGTTFHIGKLLPMEGFEVLEKLRVALGKSLKSLGPTDGMSPGTMMVATLLSLPEDVLRGVRLRMFSAVTFTNEAAQTPRPLHADEGMAFQGLEPTAIYDLLVRCLAVNFMPSFQDILSRIEGLQPNSESPSTET